MEELFLINNALIELILNIVLLIGVLGILSLVIPFVIRAFIMLLRNLK